MYFVINPCCVCGWEGLQYLVQTVIVVQMYLHLAVKFTIKHNILVYNVYQVITDYRTKHDIYLLTEQEAIFSFLHLSKHML